MRRVKRTDRRNQRIPGYLNTAEYELLKKYVKHSGIQSISKYCRFAVLQALPHTVGESLIFGELQQISNYLLLLQQVITDEKVQQESAELQPLLEQIQETRLHVLKILRQEES